MSNWNLQAFDICYQGLKNRKTPLEPDQCHELADLLAELISQHDDKIISLNVGKKPPEMFVWNVKSIKEHKGFFYIWVPQMNDDKPMLILTHKNDFFMIIEDWDKQAAGTKTDKKTKMNYYCFKWVPEDIDTKKRVLVHQLKEDGFTYLKK